MVEPALNPSVFDPSAHDLGKCVIAWSRSSGRPWGYGTNRSMERGIQTQLEMAHMTLLSQLPLKDRENPGLRA